MIVRLARERDFAGFLDLAAEVEHWFGPMVEEPGFHEAVKTHIRAGEALVAEPGREPGGRLLGGLLFGAEPPTYHVHWLVVSERARGEGVGKALMADALRRFVHGPGTIEVVTFGTDHPAAEAGGARVFYERLGYTPAEPAPPGPEGGSRQVFRRPITDPPSPHHPKEPDAQSAHGPQHPNQAPSLAKKAAHDLGGTMTKP